MPQLSLEPEFSRSHGSLYQALATELKPHDGRYPVLGSWIVNGVACGLGIREGETLITGNTSRFVPHTMVG